MVRFPRCCVPVAGLSLVACHHRLVPPGPLPLAGTELAMLVSGAIDAPLDMVTVDTPAGEELLRRPAQPVDPDDPALARLEARMRATLLVEQGVGLAAPQVGISRRVILVERQDHAAPEAEAPVELYLNPRITGRATETVVGWEGCLSVPGWRGEVARSERLRIAYDLRGEGPREEDVEGWIARIFQHEIDHLDGVLYTDRIDGGLIDEAEYQRRRQEAGDAGENQQPTE